VKRLIEHEWQKIVLYLVLTCVLGALLAPWLFFLGKEIVRQGWWAEGPAPLAYLHGALERSPFSRYFKRAVMIVAFLGLIPLIRSLQFRGWKDLQIQRNPCALIDVLAGALLAGGLLLFMGAGFLYMGLFVPEDELRWGVIPSLLATAVTVGIIEEIFFRGAILGMCLRKMTVLWSVVLTSVIYALLHFLDPPRLNLTEDQVGWSTGFMVLGKAFGELLEWQSFAAAFLTLFVIGVVLAVVRLRTRSLWLAIGLHGGWVFGYQLFNKLTDDTDRVKQWSPWVGEDLKIGLIPLAIIMLTGALASLWIDLSRRVVIESGERKEEASGEPSPVDGLAKTE
jgi:membrane protease YdiL (CAAX protease family)